MLQHTTETLLDTCPEGTKNNSKHASSHGTNISQDAHNIAEVNLTNGKNKTTEQSNKYSDDMLVDTTDHPIMKDDVKNMSIQAQEIPPTNGRMTTSYGRNVNHTNTGMKTELTGRRYWWRNTVTNTDGKPETKQKTTNRKRIADTSWTNTKQNAPGNATEIITPT